AKVAAFTLLSPEELAALEQEQLAVTAEIARLQAERKTVENKLIWFDELKTIEAAVRGAQLQFENAVQAADQAADIRLQLRVYEDMASVRPIYSQYTAKQKQVAEWQKKLAEVRQKSDEVKEQLTRLNTQKLKAEMELQQFTAGERQLNEQLTAMRLLDAQLKTLSDEIAELTKKKNEQREKYNMAGCLAANLNQPIEDDRKQVAMHQAWLDEHIRFESMVDKADLILNILQSFYNGKKQYDATERKFKESEQQKNDAQKVSDQLSLKLSAKNKEIAEKDEVITRLRNIMESFSIDTLQQTIAQLTNRIALVDQLTNRLTRKDEKKQAYDRMRTEYDKITLRLTELKEAQTSAQALTDEIEKRFTSAQQARELALQL
ncbi:MAG: hypothetical protein ACRCZQ_08285, partial [Bacteroidales bacterium]